MTNFKPLDDLENTTRSCASNETGRSYLVSRARRAGAFAAAPQGHPQNPLWLLGSPDRHSLTCCARRRALQEIRCGGGDALCADGRRGLLEDSLSLSLAALGLDWIRVPAPVGAWGTRTGALSLRSITCGWSPDLRAKCGRGAPSVVPRMKECRAV